MTIVSSPELQTKAKHVADTVSTRIQFDTELECQPLFVDLSRLPASQVEHLRECGLVDEDSLDVKLLIEKHVRYLEQTWSTERNLRMSFVSLDASRPWMLYWTLHACDLLNHTLRDEDYHRILNTIKACWTSVTENMGGFGGGISQMPHAAPTYAAVLALCILATVGDEQHPKAFAKEARQYLRDIRQPLLSWMLTLREELPSGVAIRMHHDGELDVRASYCVVAVAKLLGLLGENLTRGLSEYIVSCQTYEGGFGGEPGSEAHGGYTFCSVACLFLLDSLGDANFDSLSQWLVSRQMSFEGGFSGRSNKLVDGCYSFWQGGAVAIVSAALSANDGGNIDPWLAGKASDPSELLMDEGMLERYILLCAQDIAGGLRDKPSKRTDFYHSCYNLSGLSVAQHCGKISFGHKVKARVAETHPVYNIRLERVRAILQTLEHDDA